MKPSLASRLVFQPHLFKTALAATLALAGLSGIPAQASLILYDGFSSSDYTPSQQLLNQNPTIAGATGAWYGVSSIFAGDSTLALAYSGVASNATGGSYSSPTQGRVARTLTTPFGGDNIYYVSVMMKNSVAGGADYRAFEFGTDTSVEDNKRILQVGANGDNGDSGANWGMRVNNSASLRGVTSVTAAATVNTTVFAVIKMTFSTTAASDAVTLWINPTSLGSETESTLGGTSFTLSGLDLAGNTAQNFRMGAYGGTDVNTSEWDEIRIGTTWADVTTVPEPSTWALLTLSLGAVTLFRRKKA